jgi:hypothetical protein
VNHHILRAAFGLVAVLSSACGPATFAFDREGNDDGGDAGADASLEAEASVSEADAPTEANEREASIDAAPLDTSLACAIDGDCPASTPVCRVADGVCIRCREDDDCSASLNGPVCDTSSGQCVQCIADTQCSTPASRCDTATRACVRCLTNADCGRESTCDQTSHVCSPMF